MPDIVLVDGHSLVYRAHFALIRSPLYNSAGMNTSAVFGFANSLRKLLSRFAPEYAAVVFDAPGRTFRHELFEAYKLQRPRMPDDLIRQLPLVKQVVAGFGIRQFEVPGVEADDVLGTLAERLRAEEFRVIIASSDKDLLQLVYTGTAVGAGDLFVSAAPSTGQVVVYDPFKDILFDRGRVYEKFGVGPERIADLLALSGDSIDNIPGVPGIGDKRAQEIVRRYATLEEAIARDSRLQLHAEIARQSKELTRIRTDVELAVTTAELRIGKVDRTGLIRVFKELEFIALLKELAAEVQPVLRVQAAADWSGLAARKRVGLGGDEDRCCLAPDGDHVVSTEWAEPELGALLDNPAVLKVGYDLKAQLKRRAAGPIADVMVGAWLLDSDRKRYDLEDLMLRYCDRVVGAPTVETAPAYALSLYEKLEAALAQAGLTGLFHDLEMPLTRVLAEMEVRGVRLDQRLLEGLGAALAAEIAELTGRILDRAGVTFNLNSPQQLSQVLFEKLGLKPKRRTKTGFSTDASVLQELAQSSPIVADLLRQRELTKLQSTYLEPLMRRCDSRTGRIHTSFSQTGTSTGRLSAREPNLQNVPIRTALGKRIREAFIAEDGFRLMSADYGQIELRVLAAVTGDRALKAAFENDEDIHDQTACAVLGVTRAELTPETRRIAKMVNYGLIYGMSDFGLADRLGLPREQARAFIDAYLARFDGVRDWTQSVVEAGKAEGVVRTMLGRPRPVPGLRSANQQVYEATRRAAINSPIQGTAADIIKQAMLAVDKRLKAAGFRGGMVLQIHDELLLEIEEARVAEAETIVRSAMESVGGLGVPLKVSIGVGRNWAEIH